MAGEDVDDRVALAGTDDAALLAGADDAALPPVLALDCTRDASVALVVRAARGAVGRAPTLDVEPDDPHPPQPAMNRNAANPLNMARRRRTP